MRVFIAAFLALVCTGIISNAQANADYAREKKWADEIIPGIVVGDPVYLRLNNGRKFLSLLTEAKGAKKALILVHGTGVHPDWSLIGSLRAQLPDYGYTTLSIQMPVLAIDARDSEYRSTYPEAIERIATAVQFLHAKGYNKIGIVSHSVGSDISALYLRQHPNSLFAWAALGLSEDDAFVGVKIPVLDLYGENDLPDIVRSAAARAASLKGKPGVKQIRLPKADHFYSQQEAEMIKTVKDFLDSVP